MDLAGVEGDDRICVAQKLGADLFWGAKFLAENNPENIKGFENNFPFWEGV